MRCCPICSQLESMLPTFLNWDLQAKGHQLYLNRPRVHASGFEPLGMFGGAVSRCPDVSGRGFPKLAKSPGLFTSRHWFSSLDLRGWLDHFRRLIFGRILAKRGHFYSPSRLGPGRILATAWNRPGQRHSLL
jgi:hypothetical protein